MGLPPPSRPICSGKAGFNRHISEILSMVLEPLSHALQGYDIDSTGGLLSKIDDLNKKLQSGHERVGVFNKAVNKVFENGVFNMSPSASKNNDGENEPLSHGSNPPIIVSFFFGFDIYSYLFFYPPKGCACIPVGSN